jgi:two-component system chemotaxis response regulator CheB
LNQLSNIKPFECVIIGGSWGGIEAVGAILEQLPQSFPLPIVVVLHQHRKSGTHIPEIFKRKCVLKVKEADEKEHLEPGTVYIAPANYHLLIEQDKSISLSIDKHVNYSRPSIDVSFVSTAQVYRDTLIGILLTGANQDGSEGVAQIKRFGGLAIIEDPNTAKVPIMPQAALARTQVDQVLKLQDIANFLLAITMGLIKP